jgi:polyhydroxyalkanoate synthase
MSTSAPARPASGEAVTTGPGSRYDPVALAESLASAAEKSARLIGEFVSRNAERTPLITDELGIGKAFMELAAHMLAHPARLAEAQLNLWWEYMGLWQRSMLRMLGTPAEPLAEPASGDKRFRNEAWQEHFLFDFVKQSYLITARWLHDQVAGVEGLSEPARRASAASTTATGSCSRARGSSGLRRCARDW